MGGSPESSNASEEGAEQAVPPAVALRPRGTKGMPDVPAARADLDGAKLEDRPAIPLQPRPTKAEPVEVEIDVDPPAPELEPPPPVPRRLEPDVPPSAEPSPSAGAGDDRASVAIRPRDVEDSEFEGIRQRAAENTKGDQPLPAVTPLPLRPRAPKADPSDEVEVLDDDGGEPHPDGDDQTDSLRLQDRKTGVSRLLSESDFAEMSERLEQSESPAWERDGEGPDDGAEPGAVNMLAADEETGSYRWVELTAEDMLSPAARRRRRLLKHGALLLAAIGVLGAATIFARNAYVAMQRAEQEQAEPAPPSPDVLTPEEIAAADELARRWASITDWEQMKPLVRRPKRVHPLMADLYSETPPRPIVLGELQREKKLIRPAGTFIVLAYHIADDDLGFRFVTVEKTDSGDYLIDWELSTYHQPTPVAEFMADQPSTPTRFRVVASPDNYYDHIFPPEEFVCYRLTYPGTDFGLFGYARRDSNAADILFVQTAGRALSLVLDLRYLDDPLRDDRVEITDVAKLDWFY